MKLAVALVSVLILLRLCRRLCQPTKGTVMSFVVLWLFALWGTVDTSWHDGLFYVLRVGDLGVLAGTIVYASRRDKYFHSVGCIWGVLILYSAFLSNFAAHVAYAYDRELLEYFPEGPSVVAMLFLGWLYGIVLAGVGMVLGKIVVACRK